MPRFAWSILVLAAAGAEAQAAPRIREVTAGLRHTCALARDGVAWCWGRNQFGQLGRGVADSLPHPEPAPVRSEVSFTAVSAGEEHACALGADQRVYCWGRHGGGAVGIRRRDVLDDCGSDHCVLVPTPVDARARFVQLDAGEGHTCAVSTFADISCWGANYYRALGTPDDNNHETPTRVTYDDIRYSAVSAGGTHTCALTRQGTVRCWGFNGNGQLGFGPVGNGQIALPGTLADPRHFQSITTGRQHTCALDGARAYCWGEIADGQNASGPVPVAGQFGFAALSASTGYTCGVAVGGRAYCWGGNDLGQLGQDDADLRASREPLRVSATVPLTAVSAGGTHACAVSATGGVVCWGANTFGQLGNGQVERRSGPVAVRFPQGG